MSRPLALRVEDIGKRYEIGGLTGGYRTLRDSIVDMLATATRRSPASTRPAFWALRGASFDVEEGEVVGVIGRNGAGKSTLLKILSRVTEPTEGQAVVRGRVASLLEVGTGMHPELTGRENITLGGVVLGMSRSDVDRRFDEIVGFAEVERFLDTPVKRYSTGMYLRLAFAVAAHLEPEVLLVDEVLAVGDAAFQRKCLGKMEQIGASGRTVLFVSHNMPAVARICPRTILLAEGRMLHDGPSPEVITTYLRSGLGTMAARRWEDPEMAPGGEVARLRAVRALDDAGRTSGSFDVRRPIGIEIVFDVLTPGYDLIGEVVITNEDGAVVFAALDTDPAHAARAVGMYRTTAWIPENLMAEGTFIVHGGIISAIPQMRHAWERDLVTFLVTDPLEGGSARGDFAGNFKGVVRPLLRWDMEPTGAEAIPS